MTTDCSVSFMLEDSILGQPWFQAIIFFAYVAIFAAALIGNGLVVISVRASPRMRTVTNLLLVNLAFSDLLLAIACVPFSFVPTLVLQYWPFGAPLCKLVSFCQAVSVLVSSYTLLAISVERYAAIMRPLRPRLARRHARWVVVGIWAGALASAAPIFIVSEVMQPSNEYETCDRFICTEMWDSLEAQRTYTLALLVLQYALPLGVLLFTYTRIATEVWGTRPPGEAHNMRDMRIARNKRKMVKMMIVVVLVLTVCWAPFNILLILQDVNSELNSWEGFPYMWFVFHWLAMSHACYNPLIYWWMNARFRSAFAHTLRQVPLLRRCTPPPPAEPALARANTSTSYVSVRGPRNSHFLSTTQMVNLRPNLPSNNNFRPVILDDEDIL
ncbi:Hypothetical predicted protein [Cloeon dipterum]|uniref:G-protein coupled receptors family 1 profile domain-containing protein n=1 Tax=Cloeon dipterum TaxID=197152 RepID=A0A8S1BYA2_9INSE|nr:Hypothetical predicted protein [Cloeon dipterum]